METFISIKKMLFSNYLETLLGSRVKIKILRALFRFQTKIFTLRELAGHVKVSHTAVLNSLGDLQGMNIVKIESHGTSNLITLNKDSYMYNYLKDFFDFESNTLQKLKEELKKILPKAKSIDIFGSVSAKKEQLNSDVDVLIIVNEKSKISEIIAKTQERFSSKFGNVISAYIMSPDEFKKKRNTSFIKGILENHILVKGEVL